MAVRGTINTTRSRGDMLCDACSKAVASPRDSSPGAWCGPKPELFHYPTGDDAWRGPHHTGDRDFSSAVESGCYICYQLFQACPKETREHADSFRTFYELSRSGKDSYSLQFALELRKGSPTMAAATQVIECHGTFKILPKTMVPEAGARLGLTEDTFSGTCRRQIQSWLNQCTSRHGTCKDESRVPFNHPVRLLNIGSEGDQSVKLETLHKHGHRPRYVTVSHCWNHGQDLQPVKLTETNRERWTHGFPVDDLPKKFRDAVDIARWMDVRHLWIDALCILQDSEEDWQKQSSIMGDIYAGSYCNIAATKPASDAGCFTMRQIEVVEPYFVRSPESTESTETHVIGYDDFWCNSLLNATLHTRAWVLQERILSPRTIHFGKEQMFWECRCHKACEAYPSGIPAQFSNRRTDTWRHGQQLFNPKSTAVEVGGAFQWARAFFWRWLRARRPQTQVVEVQHAWELWSRTVERYMECYLTYDSDKLVAIAGLATKVGETTGERYLAGIWENKQLPQSLLWYTPVREQADGRESVRSPSLGQPSYRAPSWSWASVDAKIIWECPSKCARTLIDIIEVDIKSLHGHSTSAISSAAMHLQGQLFNVRLEIAHSHEDGSPNEDGSYVLSIPEVPSETILEPWSERVRQIEPIVFLDTAQGVRTVDAFFLPICSQWTTRTSRVMAAVAGLLLKETMLEGRSVYERVGVVCLDTEEADAFGGGSLLNDVNSGLDPTEACDITLI